MNVALIWDHLSLVLSALILAVGVGVPLGLLAYLFPRFGKAILWVVDLIQTVPALACIHCGYPLQSFPPPKRAPRQYSLVFTGLGPHADIPAALHCLSKELGLSQKDAQALLERAPAVLVTHLKPREAQRLVQVLAGYGISSKIVVGEEVSSPIYIPPVLVSVTTES